METEYYGCEDYDDNNECGEEYEEQEEEPKEPEELGEEPEEEPEEEEEEEFEEPEEPEEQEEDPEEPEELEAEEPEEPEEAEEELEKELEEEPEAELNEDSEEPEEPEDQEEEPVEPEELEEEHVEFEELDYGVPEEQPESQERPEDNEIYTLETVHLNTAPNCDSQGMNEIVEELRNLIHQAADDSRGLTNVFSSGGMESLVSSAPHEFSGIHPDTGAIIGATEGNLIFEFGGRPNSLCSIGKVVLDNIISGKFKRDVQPFVPGGAGGAQSTEHFQPIDFKKVRQRCLDQRILFEDPQFPANDRSLYYKTRPEDQIVWKRPGEIYENPQLIVGEKSRFDVKQGALGDCWLLAAVANLTLRDELFYRVVPPDQSFTENYAGIFHFQFWRYGQWVDVVIDDRLPTVDGQLYYMRSKETNEFWSALLEKAYAKLYGSYENLDGGTIGEALEDFTGGLAEIFQLKNADKATTLAMLVRGMQMGSLFGCSVDANKNGKEEQLPSGHAYTITAIQTVDTKNGQVPLLRIRNPWGNSTEWKGPWSDGSPEWITVDGIQRKKMEVNFAEDGEFWMSFDDFMTNFAELECCHLSADVMDEISRMTGVEVHEKQKLQWVEKQADGEWNSKLGTAGGCQNNDTYANNPQYGTFFQVPQESVENNGKCTVIAAVLQKYRREMRSKDLENLVIGFSVYKSDGRGQRISKAGFEAQEPLALTEDFSDMREVTVRFRVPPGAYIIVPCTFDANEDGAFLLRIYSNSQFETTWVLEGNTLIYCEFSANYNDFDDYSLKGMR